MLTRPRIDPIRRLNARIEHSPDDPGLWLKRGQLYQKRGEKEPCLRDLSEAIRLKPNEPSWIIWRGVANQNLGDRESAVADYDAGLQLRPKRDKYRKLALNNRGVALYEMRRYSDALADFNAVLRMDPANDNVFCKRALAHFKLNDLTQAFADLRAAETLNPMTAVCMSMSADLFALRAARDDYRAGTSPNSFPTPPTPPPGSRQASERSSDEQSDHLPSSSSSSSSPLVAGSESDKKYLLDASKIEVVAGESGFLGRGGFSVVRKGTLDVGVGRIDIAIKILLKVSSGPGGCSDLWEETEREVLLTSSLRHQNIVTCYGCWFTQSDSETLSHLALEYCSDGTVMSYLKSIGDQATPGRKLDLIREIALGIQFLHSKGVVHRDLKPCNILVHNGQAKIADFGVSKHADSIAGTLIGTPAYMPPSLDGDGKKIDTYAFGILAWEIWTGKKPYGDLIQEMQEKSDGIGVDPFHLLMQIHLQNVRPPLDIPECENMPSMLKDLIKRSWDADAAVRPDFDEIVDGLAYIHLD